MYHGEKTSNQNTPKTMGKPAGALAHLIKTLSLLPGLGPRSARRTALTLLAKKEAMMMPLVNALNDALLNIKTCPVCGALDDVIPCRICGDEGRDTHVLCVVSSLNDLWAIERAGAFRGLYHVLGGVLSALDGVGPENLNLATLEQRLRNTPFREVILALPATIEGQSTAHVIMDILAHHAAQNQAPAAGSAIKITRLAHGMPIGGELDYLDDGTILTAFTARG